MEAVISTWMRSSLLLAILLALLLTAPGWLQAGLWPWDGALGHPRADTWNHVWGYGQVAEALAAGKVPWWVDQIGWPTGGSLWFIDLPMAALLAPVTWLAGPVFAYNLGIFLNLVLAGVGAGLLARRAGASPAGALLATLCYEVEPHLLAQIANGISETIAVGWMPLTAWAVLGLKQDPSPRRGTIAGLLWAASVWANPYYGLVSSGMVGILGLSAWGPRMWKSRGSWLRMVLTAALLIGPYSLLFSRSLEGAHPLVTRDPDFVYRSLVGHNMVDLFAFFHPGKWYSPDLLALFDDQLLVVVYLGWVLLGLAALGGREARGWAVGAMAAWLLSLGPFLYIGGHYLLIGEDRYLPMPFLAFFDWVPTLSRVSHPYRFVVPTCLCLSVLAGRSLSLLPPHRLLMPLLSLLILSEILFFSPAPYPMPVADGRPSAASLWLASAPIPGAVLDLPVSLQMLDRSRYDLAQLHHHRPIPYGLNDPTPMVLRSNPFSRFLLTLERSRVTSLDPDLPLLSLEMGRKKLLTEGLAYVVVHREAYPANHAEKVLAFLRLFCGEGIEVGEATIFAMDPVSSSSPHDSSHAPQLR